MRPPVPRTRLDDPETLQPDDDAPSGAVLWIVGALALWGVVAAAVGIWMGAGK